MAARVKARSDSYSLPPASTLPAMSMGYRHALADLIWAHVLVTQGLRTQEKRPFDHIEKYFEAVNTLDPKFRPPYILADALITFQSGNENPLERALAARLVLERGVRELPHDAEVWLNYGEFLAYTGPGVLNDPADQDRWRREGAAALMRAGELSPRDEKVTWRSVAAFGLVSGKEAERAALIRFLERVYATTEDLELREHVLRKLRLLAADNEQSRVLVLRREFDAVWRTTAFVNRTHLRIIGPSRSPWECAGALAEGGSRDRCMRDWNAWSRAVAPVD